MATFVVEGEGVQPFVTIHGGLKDGQRIGIAEPNSASAGTVKTYNIKPFLDELAGTLKPREIAVVKADVERGLRTGKEPKEEVASAIWKQCMAKPSEAPCREMKCFDGDYVAEFGADMGMNRIAYIFAPSGAGKSTATRKLADQWRKNNKKGQVYVFSRFNGDSDDALKIKGAEFVSEQDMEQHIASNGSPIKCSDMNTEHGALCVFDDYDSFGKQAYAYCAETLKDILECGRKLKVCCIVTSHMALDKTKPILRTVWNESHLIGLFPACSQGRLTKYPLESYCGLDRPNIARILKLPSRVVFVKRNFPQAVISQNEIYLI